VEGDDIYYFENIQTPQGVDVSHPHKSKKKLFEYFIFSAFMKNVSLGMV